MPRRPPLGLVALQLEHITPMLARPAKELPRGGSWLYEFKYDGYRVLSTREQVRTRGGADATAWFPEIPAALTALPPGHHIIDGEVCVLERGVSNFLQLHERAMRRRWYAGAAPVVLCAFDLLVHAGQDVRGLPIEERKARLADLVAGLPSVLYVSGIDDGRAAWAAVLALQLEGIVAKRAGSLYVAGPSLQWLKIKRPGATLPGFKRDL
ncbi:ATP-dependent DNA ligase (plasmid) [Cupriavidus sp. U2]|uniref:ATP-dependent DNA ligase n=1 Tax=Cupriavidus sp. U2 TaxID=2920269 RepID=UPI001E4A1E2F|nr:hypothetical protein [Cupriavidus sp. U2]KAI3590403.1 ATP-dependent DNA ligase [Cupriavidus sp. U2]